MRETERLDFLALVWYTTQYNQQETAMWNLNVTTNFPDDTETENTFDFDTLTALLGFIESKCKAKGAMWPSSFIFVIVPPSA